MKKVLVVLCGLFLIVGITSTASAVNIALNADVTLHGTFFTGGWGSGLTVSEDTIVDGTFLPDRTQWDKGAVWWDESSVSKQFITIDLGGFFNIDSFVVQADDNDAYQLSYFDEAAIEWVEVVNMTDGNWGMTTRPEIFLPDPVYTSFLLFHATGGDGLHSVSEIQAHGTPAPVPEPTTMLLLGTGLVGLAGFGRKKFFKK